MKHINRSKMSFQVCLIIMILASSVVVIKPAYAEEPLPDLFIPIEVGGIDGVTVNPEKPDPGEPFSVNITVGNQGGNNYEDCTGTLLDGTPEVAYPADGWNCKRDIIYRDVYVDEAPVLTDQGEGCLGHSGSPIYYSEDLSFPPVQSGEFITQSVSFPNGLEAGVHQLYIYVDVNCSVDETNNNNNSYGPITVIVGVPSPFGKTAPANGATSQNLSPTLSWESSEDATSYQYCYSSAPGPCTGWVSVGNATSVTLNGLTHNYAYYWQVRAVNSYGSTEANGGTWWSFTTQTTAACNWPAYTTPVSASFSDVPMNLSYWNFVERLKNGGITAGCGSGKYCPSDGVSRASMAIFLLRGKYCGIDYVPPAVGSSTGFNDVPANAVIAPWVKQLAADRITAGCGNGNFCPSDIVSRASMAIFLLRAKHGGTYSPPGVGGSSGFNDVPANAVIAPWVKQLAAEGVTMGCGNGNYCPSDPVSRASMAIFLVRNFRLP